MGRTTRASLKGKQAADEDSTFDYNVGCLNLPAGLVLDRSVDNEK